MSDRFPIDTALVRNLVNSRFPHWSNLAIRPVSAQGNDNRTFRLGDHLSVRLPSAERYASGVDKEQRWLPYLAKYLPVQIPTPVALGRPCQDFPWHWSVYEWLEGDVVTVSNVADIGVFALELANFLVAMRAVDASDGPIAGQHSFFRGAPLRVYDEQTRKAIRSLGPLIDGEGATRAWEKALGSEWASRPVWFHGDIATTNLLSRDGRLSAVIDFGTSGVGDPACDLAIAWTFFSGESRGIFKAALCLDEATLARGRGWALWKALISVRRSGTFWPESTSPPSGHTIRQRAAASSTK